MFPLLPWEDRVMRWGSGPLLSLESRFLLFEALLSVVFSAWSDMAQYTRLDRVLAALFLTSSQSPSRISLRALELACQTDNKSGMIEGNEKKSLTEKERKGRSWMPCVSVV
jgi:hypothetical protein